jgi:hypothetical protein
MCSLLIKKRKQIFEENFQKCITAIATVEIEISKFQQATKKDYFLKICELVKIVNGNFKKEMIKIYEHQDALKKNPNYEILNGLLSLVINA